MDSLEVRWRKQRELPSSPPVLFLSPGTILAVFHHLCVQYKIVKTT
jgi:hypothetical protein